MIVGYARTSTLDQAAGLSGQIRDLKAAGADSVVGEQVSSVAPRPSLDALLDSLHEGDVLLVTKPDRLARDTAHLLGIHQDLERRGIGLIILSMGGRRLDTRSATSKLILTVLAGVAAWEREIMLERQREGISKAKAEGKYKGRLPTIHREEVFRLRGLGWRRDEIATHLNCAVSSVYRVLSAPTSPIDPISG